MTNTPQSPDKETVDELDEILDYIENYGVSSSQDSFTSGQYTKSRQEAKAKLQQLLIKERIDECGRADIYDTRGLVFRSEDEYGNHTTVSQAERIANLENQLGEKS